LAASAPQNVVAVDVAAKDLTDLQDHCSDVLFVLLFA
jgi:hypothetical protein